MTEKGNQPANGCRSFAKYRLRGDYHWRQVTLSPLHRNPFVHGRYLQVVRLVKQYLGPHIQEARVLDLGCGDGVLTSMIGRLGSRVTGIDSSDIAIDIARERLASQSNVDFVSGSVYAIPWPDATFDIVVSSEVIEHLSDTQLFLKEIVRVLRPGGGVVLSTPIRTTEFLSDKEHVVEWFRTEFEAVVNSQMPGAVFAVSHPLALLELQQRRYSWRVLLATLSLVANPFISAGRAWRHYTLQYAVWRKPVAANSGSGR